MNVTVRLFAVLRERAGRSEITLENLPDAIDVAGLKRELERRVPALGNLDRIAGVVGTSYVRDSHSIHEGDDVSFLPPVSGGSGRRARDGDAERDDASRDDDRRESALLAAGLFELRNDPLDPAACERRVAHASCGANVTFVGTTRDEHRGRKVVHLEYEAFEAMTEPEMARIFERCRGALTVKLAADRHSELAKVRMLCQHRVGTVAVGHPSVVIAVASPHRDIAFEACRFLIDELKETLPIWKKEIFEDGESWVGERS